MDKIAKVKNVKMVPGQVKSALPFKFNQLVKVENYQIMNKGGG